MDNENGLDLTLSLPCGGPSTSLKGKNGGGSEEADRGSKLIDDFKNFLDGGNHKEDSTVGSQRSNQSKPEENLFYDLSKATINVDASSNINNRGFWGKSDGRSSEVQEERRQDAGSNKRKNLFEEINHQKRHEREAYLAGLHVSMTTDEGSTAENEDVADSEADGSTSKLVPHRDDASKRHPASTEGAKEVCGVSDSNGADLQGQRRFTVSSEKEFKAGHVSHGVPFSGQPANILNMPYSLSVKESNSNPASGTIPVIASASNDRPGAQQPIIPANLPLMFGYPAVEAASTPVNAPKPFERAKSDGKLPKDEGTSTQPEGNSKGANGSDPSRPDPVPPEYPAIRPGIAVELKFGGSGSSPNLPWVSTTGPGPNGKTISGVTYRYSGTQIRIVCACHGSHMSPEEFVQHASEEQPSPAGGGPGLAASAQN